MNDLEKARRKIDGIDRQMAKLLAKRLETVRALSEYKRAHGLPICDPDREEQILRRCAELTDDRQTALCLKAFFESVLKLSRDYQTALAANAAKEGEETPEPEDRGDL